MPQFLYKCRRCEVRFIDQTAPPVPGMGSLDWLLNTRDFLNWGQTKGPLALPVVVHDCPDQGAGIAELLGGDPGPP